MQFFDLKTPSPPPKKKWEIIASRNFNTEEKEVVLHAEVVALEYGNGVCFSLKSGGKAYIPVSIDSICNIGDVVDMNKSKLLKLHRDGYEDINRVEVISVHNLPKNKCTWKIVNSRNFTEEEQGAVLRAEVVPSGYGKSVCFFMRSGGQTYIPLTENSTLCVGDTVDLSLAKILTLHRDGSADINRVEI